MKIDELNFVHKETIGLEEFTKKSYKFEIQMDGTDNIKLWWPNGYGDQKMYNLSVELKIGSDSLVKSKSIGFRSIELVEEPVNPNNQDNGLSFYFKINNVDIFLLGSNWIPADSFQELIDETRLKYLLESAKAANMNVLRVWGGGIYETEKFYELTDKLGILIWQDFMFACSVGLYIYFFD